MKKCVVCGSKLHHDVVLIGDQYPSAIFTTEKDPFRNKLNKSSLNLTKCSNHLCGLIQLSEPVSLADVFEKYPYESSSTLSMKSILLDVKSACEGRLPNKLNANDIILDIGGNDGTLLSLFADSGAGLVNIDAAHNVKQVISSKRYKYVNSLFSQSEYINLSLKPPKLITSVAMFYHLIDPISFTKDVARIMDNDSIWCLQMSYAGSMMKNCIVDNIVHEHITYYTLKSLNYLMNLCGLEIFDAEIIPVYGGSIRAFIKKKSRQYLSGEKSSRLKHIEDAEELFSYNELSSLINFNNTAITFKNNFRLLLDCLIDQGESIYGFGASTKGNMLLQFLDITGNHMYGVFDNSPKKIGTTMIGSNIKVLDERCLDDYDVSTLISLPYYYHDDFKKLIPKLSKKKCQNKIKLIKPLPLFERHLF